MTFNLLTKAEVADLLTVSIDTIDRMRRKGDFVPAIQIGGTLRWRDTDVKAWLDAKTNGVTVGATVGTNIAPTKLADLMPGLLPNKLPSYVGNFEHEITHDAAAGNGGGMDILRIRWKMNGKDYKCGFAFTDCLAALSNIECVDDFWDDFFARNYAKAKAR